MGILPYDPGVLPSRASPKAGESIKIEVSGYPPFKDEHFSIRNPRHRIYGRFVKLRTMGIKAMRERAWYFGPISLSLTLYANEMEEKKRLIDYMAGIEDTLDGSSGCAFTYLPIFFEDDRQVVEAHSELVKSNKIKYKVQVQFL